MPINVTTRGAKGSELTHAEMDTNFTSLGRDATLGAVGNIQLASQAEVDAGTNSTKAVTPATLASFSGGGGTGDIPTFTTPAETSVTLGDVIIKSGRTSSAIGANGTLAFAAAFPNQCVSVNCTPIHTTQINPNPSVGGDAAVTQLTAAPTINGFSFVSGVENAANDTFLPQSLSFNWIAVGY